MQGNKHADAVQSKFVGKQKRRGKGALKLKKNYGLPKSQMCCVTFHCVVLNHDTKNEFTIDTESGKELEIQQQRHQLQQQQQQQQLQQQQQQLKLQLQLLQQQQ